MLGRCALILTLVAVVVATAPVARACDPAFDGQGGFRCGKSERRVDATLTPAATRYLRARPLRLPRRLTGAAAMRLLVTSRWLADGAARGPTTLRFLDAAALPEGTASTDASVVVAAVTWQQGHYRIDLAGTPYQLERCRDQRGRATTCLVPATDP